MIPDHESKQEEKTLVLSSAMAEIVVKTKEDTQISGDGVGFEHKEVKKRCG